MIVMFTIAGLSTLILLQCMGLPVFEFLLVIFLICMGPIGWIILLLI
jgi:hypothetical protein